MMKKLKSFLSDKQGNALIFGVFMLIVIVTLFCVLLSFVQIKTTIAYVRDTSQAVLDRETIESSREWVASVKNGSDFNMDLDNNKYKNLLRKELKTGTDFVGTSGDMVRFKLSNITLGYTTQNRLKTNVSYTLYVPFYLMGIEVTSLEATVKLKSRYILKE